MRIFSKFWLGLGCCILTTLWIFCCLPANLHAQDIEYGPAIRKSWYDSFIRLLKGGDGNYYLLRTGGGSIWNFSPEGERGFFIHRFDKNLQPLDEVRVGPGNPKNLIQNAYEVVPTRDGIAFLSVRRPESTGPHMLNVCRPRYDKEDPYFDCTELFPMHDLLPGISKPHFRVVQSPDSSIFAVTWQKLSKDNLNDNSSGCVLLDRDLNVVEAPFLPLKQALQEVRIHRLGIIDKENLFFHLRAFNVTGVFQNPQALGFGLLHYDVEERDLRWLKLGNGAYDPMEVRVIRAWNGRLLAAGWYLGRASVNNEAGIFFGEITDADSLERLQLYPFDENMRKTMIFDRKRKEDIGFRRTLHNSFFEMGNGTFVFVLHFRGKFEGEELDLSGEVYDNVLVAYHFDRNGKVRLRHVRGFGNVARDDYKDAFSWRRLTVGGKSWALFTDFGDGKRAGRPDNAKAFLWPLGLGEPAGLTPLEGPELQKGYVIAPRLVLRDEVGAYVALVKSIKGFRLARIRF
ncbi:MAG: hypothetical protein AAF570_01335 [Bacteroidota bacterium]